MDRRDDGSYYHDSASQPNYPDGRAPAYPSEPAGRRRDDQRPSDGPPHPMTAFTREDMQLLEQCSREAFYQRALPLMIVGNGLLMYRHRTSPLPVPQMTKSFRHLGVTIVCWMLGKLSYRKNCEDKIIASSLSTTFANKVRERRGLTAKEFVPGSDIDNMPASGTFPSMQRRGPKTNAYGDIIIDDRNSTMPEPSYDQQQPTEEGFSPSKYRGVTYDDLRDHNRRHGQQRPLPSSRDA